MSTLTMQQPSVYSSFEKARIKFRDEFSKGITITADISAVFFYRVDKVRFGYKDS